MAVIHHRHLSEAIAHRDGLNEAILAAPGLQNGRFAALQDEQCIALFALVEKELVPGDCHDRAKCQQKLEDVRAYPTKECHTLQEFGPRILHGALHKPGTRN